MRQVRTAQGPLTLVTIEGHSYHPERPIVPCKSAERRGALTVGGCWCYYAGMFMPVREALGASVCCLLRFKGEKEDFLKCVTEAGAVAQKGKPGLTMPVYHVGVPV